MTLKKLRSMKHGSQEGKKWFWGATSSFVEPSTDFVIPMNFNFRRGVCTRRPWSGEDPLDKYSTKDNQRKVKNWPREVTDPDLHLNNWSRSLSDKYSIKDNQRKVKNWSKMVTASDLHLNNWSGSLSDKYSAKDNQRKVKNWSRKVKALIRIFT